MKRLTKEAREEVVRKINKIFLWIGIAMALFGFVFIFAGFSYCAYYGFASSVFCYFIICVMNNWAETS